MRKRCLTMIAMLSIAYANNVNFDQGKQMAQLGNATIKETANFKSFKAENYSNQAINSTTAESYFEKSDAEIREAGVNAMATNKTVKSMQQHHENRKPLNPVDNPTLNRMKHIMQNSKEISHGQSTDKYQCSQVQANCVTKKVNHDCLSADVKTLQCYYKPEVSFVDVPYQTQATFSGQLTSSTPTTGKIIPPESGTITAATVQLENHGNNIYLCKRNYWGMIAGNRMSSVWPNCGGGAGGLAPFRVNGISIPVTAGIGVNFQLQCEAKWSFFGGGGSICSHHVAAYRPWTITMNVTRYKKEPRITWSNTCNPIYLNQCTKVKEVCIEPKATRTFGAESVTLDCWNYQQTYQCGNANINTCGQYQSCNFIQKVCNQTIGEYCVQHKEMYQCTEEHCDSNQMLCGKATAMCLDGNCQSDDPEPNTGKDFAPSVSALAGIFAAGQDLKDQQQSQEGNFAVFKGKVADCGKAGLGIYNCCADNGGVVKNCSDSEKALYHARQKGFATQVGEYCAKRVLGACVLWHEGWCIFESKLARIINEQGRRQLGISFGDPKHPNCQGLTPEMLQQIEFDQVNFSEVFSDIASSKAFPNTQKLNDSIAKTAQATLQGLGK